ncbi:MAG: helix-turn-helix domain-containing protein [archaeon]
MVFSKLESFFNTAGLTEYEAKALTALFKLKECKAPDISRVSEVPKTRVYDVLNSLVGKKMVLEVSGRPKRYKLFEAGEIFNSLLEEKKNDLMALEETALSLQQELPLTSNREENEKIMKVKSVKDFQHLLALEVGKAKESVKGFTQLNGKEKLMENLSKAANSNVSVRIINSSKSDLKNLEEKIKLKQFQHNLNALIIDDKKVVLGLNDTNESKPEYHFSIHNNNNHLLEMLQSHFDKYWEKTST